MLYVYFTGKRDILNFILKGTIDPAFIPRDFELPVRSEIFDSLDDEIIDALERNMKEFSSHLDNITNYPPEQMLSDAFDVIIKYGVGCLLIEKNPDDLRKLTDYYKEYRRKFFEQVLSYITLYMQKGTFRQVAYPNIAPALSSKHCHGGVCTL